MGLQAWSEPLGPIHDTIGASYTNSITITDVSPGGLTDPLLILPTKLQRGTVLEVEAWGTISTSATTPTLILGIYYGGVAGLALSATTAVTMPNTAAVAWPWRIKWSGKVLTSGTSGTIEPMGEVHIPTSLTAFTARRIPETTLAAVTIDMTQQKALTIGATWGAAAATNILICRVMTAEVHG